MQLLTIRAAGFTATVDACARDEQLEEERAARASLSWRLLRRSSWLARWSARVRSLTFSSRERLSVSISWCSFSSVATGANLPQIRKKSRRAESKRNPPQSPQRYSC